MTTHENPHEQAQILQGMVEAIDTDTPVASQVAEETAVHELLSEFEDHEAFGVVAQALLYRAKARHPAFQEQKIPAQPLLSEVSTREPSQVGEALQPPRGFIEDMLLPNPLIIPVEDIVNSGVQSLTAQSRDKVEVSARRLVTEHGSSVILCDLRPLMTKPVRSAGPSQKVELKKLEARFYRDLSIYADRGVIMDNVAHIDGTIGYSKPSKTKTRAYWLPVSGQMAAREGHHPEPVGERIIARLADSVGERGEEDLYRRVFGMKL